MDAACAIFRFDALDLFPSWLHDHFFFFYYSISSWYLVLGLGSPRRAQQFPTYPVQPFNGISLFLSMTGSYLAYRINLPAFKGRILHHQFLTFYDRQSKTIPKTFKHISL